VPPPFVDVDCNGFVVPLDSLLVINFLNAGGAGEGEGEPSTPAASAIAASGGILPLPFAQSAAEHNDIVATDDVIARAFADEGRRPLAAPSAPMPLSAVAVDNALDGWFGASDAEQDDWDSALSGILDDLPPHGASGA
jgi:hypothetical protein